MVSSFNPVSPQQQAVVNPFQQRLDAQVRGTGKDDSQVNDKGDATKPSAKQSVGTSFSSPSSVSQFAVSDNDSDDQGGARSSRNRGSLVDITV